MATQVLKSLKGRRVRLLRLDDCGVPVEGACSTVVTDGFIRVTIGAEFETGDEFITKNAWGDLCVNEKDSDVLKRVNVEIEFCEVHPDIASIVAGSAVDPIVVSSDTVGFSMNGKTNDQGFAVEVWTKVAGAACEGGSPVWGHFLVPFVKNGRPSSDLVIENGALTFSMAGDGFPEVGWGTGPWETNPLGAGLPAGALFSVVTTEEQPPAVTAGCVAYAEPT